MCGICQQIHNLMGVYCKRREMSVNGILIGCHVIYRHVLDIWRTMAGESNLSLSIFDYVLDLSLRSLPYQEKPKPKHKKETIRIATVQPAAVSFILKI